MATELTRLLGATKSEQAERLKQRLERRRQLKEEREAQGLETGDNVIDEIIQHEEARKEVLEERKKRHVSSLKSSSVFAFWRSANCPYFDQKIYLQKSVYSNV